MKIKSEGGVWKCEEGEESFVIKKIITTMLLCLTYSFIYVFCVGCLQCTVKMKFRHGEGERSPFFSTHHFSLSPLQVSFRENQIYDARMNQEKGANTEEQTIGTSNLETQPIQK